MLVTATNVSGNDFQDNTVFAFAVTYRKLRILDFLHFDLPGPDVSNSMILTHKLVIKGCVKYLIITRSFCNYQSQAITTLNLLLPKPKKVTNDVLIVPEGGFGKYLENNGSA
ncbi:hypothetical protein D3C87_1781940 [compost metagenome]